MVFFTDKTSKESIAFHSYLSKSIYLKLTYYRNWDEARKAYLNALKYDKENQNVLRDLGQL